MSGGGGGEGDINKIITAVFWVGADLQATYPPPHRPTPIGNNYKGNIQHVGASCSLQAVM